MDDLTIIWIIAAAVFTLIELLTLAFVAIYFALGAGAAAIVAALGGGIGVQLLAFALTGIGLLVLTKPVLKRRLESPDMPTNVDRMVGKSGMVTIAIDNGANTGQIRVGTEYWTARWPEELDREPIPVGAQVRILEIEGVTARVELRSDD